MIHDFVSEKYQRVVASAHILLVEVRDPSIYTFTFSPTQKLLQHRKTNTSRAILKYRQRDTSLQLYTVQIRAIQLKHNHEMADWAELKRLFDCYREVRDQIQDIREEWMRKQHIMVSLRDLMVWYSGESVTHFLPWSQIEDDV